MAEAIRSFERFTPVDLNRLASMAQDWLADVIVRLPATCGSYRDRLLLIALCQGGAQHYVDGKHGVKDLDVWAFFRAHRAGPFPYRTVWHQDFGPSHFGRHPNDKGFTGRKVDLIGRSIEARANEDPVEAVRRWLSSRTASAQHLAQRPVIGLFPPNLAGAVIWQPASAKQRIWDSLLHQLTEATRRPQLDPGREGGQRGVVHRSQVQLRRAALSDRGHNALTQKGRVRGGGALGTNGIERRRLRAQRASRLDHRASCAPVRTRSRALGVEPERS